jgi:hypothetical protein
VRGGVDNSRGVLKDDLNFEGSCGGAAHREGGFWNRDITVVCACVSGDTDDEDDETERDCDAHCGEDARLDGPRATAGEPVLYVARAEGVVWILMIERNDYFLGNLRG